VLAASVSQLEKIFGQLEQQHMSGEHPEAAQPPSSLPRASAVYLGGMYWDWQPGHHKYIGGGYCSPRVNKPINSGASIILMCLILCDTPQKNHSFQIHYFLCASDTTPCYVLW